MVHAVRVEHGLPTAGGTPIAVCRRIESVSATAVTIKHRLYRLFGKDSEAVVVSFLSGPAPLALRMVEQIRGLVPDRAHYAVSLDDEPVQIAGVTCMGLSEAG